MFVERFIAWAGSASADERAQAIGEVASSYMDPVTSADDRVACERIFSIFLDDPSSHVRIAMAQSLALCDYAPRALLWNLANDIPEVSTVIFEYSRTLCERTLINAVTDGNAPVQAAIARREDLTCDVVRSIATQGQPKAVLSLLDNEGVVLAPNLKHDLAERLGENPDVRGALLDEDDLLPQTRQTLMLKLTGALSNLVEDNAWMEKPQLKQVANDSKNRAMLDIAMETDAEAMISYVEHLVTTDQLTPALLLRSICSGNALFFEYSVAYLAGKSIKRVQSIVDEGRMAAFKALYKRTGLPGDAYPVFATAITVWQKIGAENLEASVGEALLCERAIDEILSLLDDEQGLDPALMALLRRLSAEATRDLARADSQQLLLTAA